MMIGVLIVLLIIELIVIEVRLKKKLIMTRGSLRDSIS